MHKIITKSEVLQHNKKKDCWIIIQNKVYDITQFLKIHPGGSDILLTRAGEDATSFFFARHGKNKAIQNQLKNFLIGELPEVERVDEEAFNEPFIEELIHACNKNKLFAVSKKLEFKYNLMRFFSLFFFFTSLILVFYLKIDFYFAIPLVILNAFIGTSLFGFIAHENTHRNYPKNNVLKQGLTAIWPIIWPFISQKPLQYEHNSHHVKIGDIDYDFEVAGFAKFIRYSGQVPHNKYHTIQHKIALFLYPFYANIITTWGGIKSDFWKTHNKKVTLFHNITIIWTFTIYAIVPSLIHGNLFYFLSLYLVYQCVLFYGVYIGAAINHFIPQASENIDETLGNKYGYYICANTSNFSINSKFWFWYTGGFNIQIEHHLIPFVPVENLKKLIPIVKELCAKHNYPYIEFKTFNELWDAHYEYLMLMAEKETSPTIENEVRNKTLYQAR